MEPTFTDENQQIQIKFYGTCISSHAIHVVWKIQNYVTNMLNSPYYISFYHPVDCFFNSPRLGISVSLKCFAIGSQNELRPLGKQTITWTGVNLLSIGNLEANLNEIWITMTLYKQNTFENVVLKILHFLVDCLSW